MESQEGGKFPGAEPRIFYGYYIIAASLLIMTAIWGLYYAFGIFFKPMLNEFGWSRAMTSGAFSLASIVSGVLAIAMGSLTDKFGPRIVITLCGLLLGIGSFLISQISALWQLYLFYGLIVGTGMGGGYGPLLSTAARWFVKRRGLMSGFVTAGIGMGGIIVPLVASRLISAYGWRLSYLILGSIIFLVIILSAQVLRRDPAQMGQVAYGENEGEKQGLLLETETLSFNEAIHTWQFYVVSGLLFCQGFTLFATMVHLVPHAIELGISVSGAANIIATMSGVSVVSKIFMGRVVDTIGSRQTYRIGVLMMSIGMFWLVPANAVWKLYLFSAVFGFGYGGCSTSSSPLVAMLFGLGSHGLIFGVATFLFRLGGSIGPFMNGYIFDVTGSYQLGFLICGVISFIGLILVSVLKPIRM